MSDITAERLWRACRRGRCSVAAKLIHWLGPKHMQSLQELACGLQLCYLPTIHISTFVNKVLLVHSLRPPPPLAHTAAPSFNPCCRSASPATTLPPRRCCRQNRRRRRRRRPPQTPAAAAPTRAWRPS